MKKGLTELVFILDKSGSMADMVSDTIGGFNSMIEKQKNIEGETLVSTVVFNTESTVIHDRVNLFDVKKLTENDYEAWGGTALIDAIGDSVKHISRVHKYIREEDRPEKTLFVITTDGMENSSHKFSSNEVKKMISKKKEEGWDFLFLGANIDAVETAAKFGISRDFAVDYHSDKKGIKTNFEALGKAVFCARAAEAIPASWKETIEEDFASRK